MTLGQKIKAIRISKQLSQEAVADHLHISRQTLSKWELGKSLPDLTSLKNLALFYDFSLDEIVELAKEREEKMENLTPENMAVIMQGKIDCEEASLEQSQFLISKIIRPLMEQIGEARRIYYFTVQKQTASIWGVAEPIKSADAKEYLHLFHDDCSDFWFITDAGIVYFNIISFLQAEAATFQPYSTLEYLCLGREFAAIDQKNYNPPAIGIFAKDRSYNWAIITEADLAKLSYLLPRLTKASVVLLELKDYGLTTFVKKWRKEQKI